MGDAAVFVFVSSPLANALDMNWSVGGLPEILAIASD